MFFKKEKKPIKLEEKSFDSLLGRLLKKIDWVTEKVFSWEIFDRKDEVLIYVSYTDDEHITSYQKIAISFLLNNYTQLQTQSEELILNFFSCKNTCDFSKNISIENISITKQGEIILCVDSSFSDEFLESNLPDNTIFDDCFGILIYPKQMVLPNEKELNKLLIN